MYKKHKQIDLELIHSELVTLPEYNDQLYLQGKESNSDPMLENYLEVDRRENEYKIPLYNLPYINELMASEGLIRTRVMKLFSKRCYFWHKDTTKRLHIPIITNPHCFLLIGGVQFHLPADGYSYVVDTTKMHTAVNASKEERVHIVGAFG